MAMSEKSKRRWFATDENGDVIVFLTRRGEAVWKLEKAIGRDREDESDHDVFAGLDTWMPLGFLALCAIAIIVNLLR